MAGGKTNLGDGKEHLRSTLRVPVWKTGLTLSCADSKHSFKVGTGPEQLQKLRDKLEALFVELVEKRRVQIYG